MSQTSMEIASYLHYLPAVEEPLSADVFCIEGERCTYLYDVGCNEEALTYITALPKEKVIILSHFHPDHVGNIGALTYKELYVGKQTFQKIKQGMIVEDKLKINDGVNIEILHCPSPHAKGSLIVTVNKEYTLLGDLHYTIPEQNHGLALEMLAALRKVDTRYFVISHEEESKICEKEKFLKELTAYFRK